MTDTSSTTTETSARRVEAWRASGKRAEEFSWHEGYAASTLRWWSSKLEHEIPPAPEVRLACVVRTVTAVPAPAPALALASPFAAIMIDVTSTSVRVAVGPGADRETLAMVLDLVRSGAAR